MRGNPRTSASSNHKFVYPSAPHLRNSHLKASRDLVMAQQTAPWEVSVGRSERTGADRVLGSDAGRGMKGMEASTQGQKGRASGQKEFHQFSRRHPRLQLSSSTRYMRLKESSILLKVGLYLFYHSIFKGRDKSYDER